MRIQEENTKLHKKVERRICVRDITLLAAHPPSYVIFCRFIHLLSPFGLLQFYVEKKTLLQKMVGAGFPLPPNVYGPVSYINQTKSINITMIQYRYNILKLLLFFLWNSLCNAKKVTVILDNTLICWLYVIRKVKWLQLDSNLELLRS